MQSTGYVNINHLLRASSIDVHRLIRSSYTPTKRACHIQDDGISLPLHMGYSQAVRHWFLISACGGSNPPTPAISAGISHPNLLNHYYYHHHTSWYLLQ